MRPRIALGVGLACAVGGCVSAPTLQNDRFIRGDIIAMENESWHVTRVTEKLPANAVPMDVQDLRCRYREPAQYDCNFKLIYGSAGTPAGFIERRDHTFVRNRQGRWSYGITLT